MRNRKSPKQRNLFVAGKMSNIDFKAKLTEQHVGQSKNKTTRPGVVQTVGSFLSNVTTMVGRGKKVH